MINVEPHNYPIYYVSLIYVISMEFLLQRRRRSSVRNVPMPAAKNEEKRLFSQAMLVPAVKLCRSQGGTFVTEIFKRASHYLN